MRFFRSHDSTIPSPAETLPGRPDPILRPGQHTVLDTPLAGPWPEGTRTAVFGLGCFWGAEKAFWRLPGVVSTAVGYAGGSTPNATYREACSGKTGHAEVVQVAYDPKRLSYEDLLRLFWEHHNPTQGMRQGNDVGTQYRSIVLVADEEQRRIAEASRDAYQTRLSAAGFRNDHDRDRRRRPVLLRRGRAPAIPRQEPPRLLPRLGHRRRLPDRAPRGRLVGRGHADTDEGLRPAGPDYRRTRQPAHFGRVSSCVGAGCGVRGAAVP